MNKLITTLCFVMLSAMSQAQQPCYWHENMENMDSVIATPFGSWDVTTTVAFAGFQSDSSTVTAGATNYLETDPMDFTGLFFVNIEFYHISRVDFFDKGSIEMSIGMGPWSNITVQYYDQSLPDYAALMGQGFWTSGVNLGWMPGTAAAPPDNSMWTLARYLVSIPAGNQANVRFRFKLEDAGPVGNNGYPGWYVDEICVKAAACELTPPTVLQIGSLQGTVYNLGPYTVNFDIQDASNILSANLTYTVDGLPAGGTTIPLTLVSGSTYTATIPAVNDSQVVCYSVIAIDSSGCNNATSYPATGTICFTASTGITFPYCDNFDVNNLWLDSGSVAIGSIWERGAPISGWPNAAHSAPNIWEVALNQPYLDQTECYLYSPIFSFFNTFNANIDLWLNVQCENFWDGTRIDYTTDLITWNVLGAMGTGTNWYNNNAINSSGMPAWTGSSQIISGQSGWFKATHNLSILDGQQTVQMRFVFTSDFSVTGDGFAIDDICITEPSPQDAGVTQIIQPTGQAPAGSCLPVIVTIQNFGSQAITSTDITYVQTSGAGMPQTGTITWQGNLAPGATVTDTILSCFTVPAGTFCIQAYTTLPSDGNFFNDSTSLCGIGIPVLTPTVCDDFESGNLGWLASPASNGWELGAPAFGQTTGGHNSVNAWDVNLTTPYVDNALDTLYTPIYNMAGAINPSLSFWQNRNTEVGDDGFWIEYEKNSNGVWLKLGTCVAGGNAVNWYNQCNLNFTNFPAWDGSSNGWIKSSYFLSSIPSFPGTNFMRFRFVFTSNFFTVLDGVSIDDFCVTIPCPNDVGPITVNSYVQALGGSNAAGDMDSVQVTLHNFGTNSQTGVNITYQIVQNGMVVGGPFGPYLWPGTLGTTSATWNSPIIVLPLAYTVPAGGYQIQVFTSLPGGDCDALNDTLNASGVGVPIIPIDYNNPYCDDFESGNVGWTVQFAPGGDPGTIWEFGLPAFAPTNTTHSGVVAWDINLGLPYTSNANVYLKSPIFDFTNAVDTRLEFWLNYALAQSDGVNMEVSINNGIWQHFGGPQVFFPTQGQNWYSATTITSNPAANGAWSNSSNGWKQSVFYKLDINPQLIVFTGQAKVQFRYHFTSGPFSTGAGISLDDFCLIVLVPLTTTPTAITDLPTTPHLNFPGQAINFRTTIKNDGTTAVNSTAIKLVVDGVDISKDTVLYATPLAPGASQTYNFLTPYIGAPGIHNVCAITSYPNSSADLKPVNDTICTTILIFDSAQIGATAKCYDFEGGAQWVDLNSITLLPTSSWALGTPNKPTINTANSGTNAWITGGLTANYNGPDTSSLFSPLFIINGALVYNLSFFTQFLTEKNFDGGTVDYSIDYGVTWTQFGSQQDPNWMNTYDILALQIGAPGPFPHAGWSGQVAGWTQRDRDFCLGIVGTQNIIFRWRFNSDFSTEDEGWAIDDVCLTPLAAFCPVSVQEINDGFSLLQNAPNPFGDVTTISFSIKEKGFTELQILDITGQLVSVPLSKELGAGNYTINLSAGDLASGVYFYSLKHNDTRVVKKMVVSK